MASMVNFGFRTSQTWYLWVCLWGCCRGGLTEVETEATNKLHRPIGWDPGLNHNHKANRTPGTFRCFPTVDVPWVSCFNLPCHSGLYSQTMSQQTLPGGALVTCFAMAMRKAIFPEGLRLGTFVGAMPSASDSPQLAPCLHTALLHLNGLLHFSH